MKLALIIIALMSGAFAGGFFLAGWVRQATIDELHRDIAHCRDGSAKLHDALTTLASELTAFRRSLGG